MERGARLDSRDGEAGQRVRWPAVPRRASHAQIATLVQERCGTWHRDDKAVGNCMDGGGPIQPIQALSGGLKRFPGHRAPLLSEIPIAFERNADKNIVTDSCVGLWRVASIGITAASTCKRARSTCFGVSNYWGVRALDQDAGRTDRNRAYGHLGIPCRRHACLSEVSEMPCSHVAHSLVKSCRRRTINIRRP